MWASGDFWGDPSAPLDPDLGPLQNNGGMTLTRAPNAWSLAVDNNRNTDWWFGCEAVYSSDQRGLWRPMNGNDDGDTWCDIGAVERQGPNSP